MESQAGYLQHNTPGSSSSSAIDLTGTPAGIASSAPPSPSLEHSDSVARKRLSWGRVDTGQDPLGLDISSSTPSTSNIDRNRSPAAYTVNDDPFDTPAYVNLSLPARDDIHFNNIRDYEPQHDDEYNPYSTSHPGHSTASLLQMDGQREDDEAGLTSNMSRSAVDQRWRMADYGEDAERSAGATPRSKRTVRYSTSPSPLKKTGTAIKSVSKNLRRVSLRVVNLANTGLENQIRLPDDEDEAGRSSGKRVEAAEDDQQLPDLGKSLPIRGRTICCLGPDSKLRLLLYKTLMFPWTEPTILLLIIINAVILTIQAARSFTLPDGAGDGEGTPPIVKGYFHRWEDYVLFALFIIFTLEAFARICVSGFIFDPEIPTSTFFTSPFSSFSDMPMSSIGPSSSTNDLTRQASMHTTDRGGPLSRGLTLTQRLNRLNHNIKRPFALPTSVQTSTEVQSGPSLSNVSLPSNRITEKIKHTVQASHNVIREPAHPTFLSNVLRTDRKDPGEVLSLPFKLSVSQANEKTTRNVPYLRQSWGRIDFVAIVSFWICFVLASLGLERGTSHIGIFRALSVMRTARLLTITSGTTTIMHSLKTARPLLASVAYFVLFAMILFSIIGIQSFKGSLRRACYLNPVNGEPETPIDGYNCGGYIDPNTLETQAYLLPDGSPSDSSAKGYICPLGQVCRESENPYNNVESFDTIYYAALQVIIVATANGWSPLMYSIIQSEFFISSVFFIICVIVLNFWLINLFVAVITNTFSAIRSETQKSAFGAAAMPVVIDEQDDGWSAVDGRRPTRPNIAKAIYEYTRWCWVLLALASLVLQATRSAQVTDLHEQVMYYGELGITLAFDLEILIRVLAALPDWRNFFAHGNNWLDTILAIGSSIIQIPAIHNSTIYAWFTIFPLARFYRVILEVPRMKPLLLAVFGNMYGLANMSLFLFLVNFIAALVSVQLLRGDMSSQDNMNFGQIYNAFLAVYQIFSSENWTDILYDSATAEIQLGQTVIVVLFICVWMLFANFIVLQMFIAVINENFDVAEEQKKSKQASHYWASHQVQAGKSTWMRRLNPYRWYTANPVKVKVENLPSNLVLPMQKALVQEYNVSSVPVNSAVDDRATAGTPTTRHGARHYTTKSLSALQKLFAGDDKTNDVPLATLKHTRSETLGALGDEETERQLELLASVNPETMTSDDINDALYERRMQKADFIRDRPTYDKTFWLFSQKNRVRKLCQKVVQPAHGERIFGTPPSHLALPVFQVFIFLAVIGGIVTEVIATPVYRRNYFNEFGRTRAAWFDIAEATFSLVLVVEFFIKIAADGFSFTPNAYIRSIWNVIDFVILIGILVNVVTGLIFIGGLSRLTRSLKALRALRLITLFDRMRSSFQSLIISGASRILDAALLAILYMIPYAVWGLNIFAGMMNECNDTNVQGVRDCINEYDNTVYGTAFGFPVPRVWHNPNPSTVFSFDSFRSSLLILFEIVSLEGWIDVMNIATSITGPGQQPQTNASQWNAIFFLIYNLLGGVVILTLFVSIIIGNFSARTGTALLTQPQREWINLQKLFNRQRPSKRPQHRPTGMLRSWCFDRAVHKHGWWSRGMSFLFVLHVIILMTQTYSSNNITESLRNDFFLVITLVYIVDVSVRFTGLGWTSFRANGWNLFDVIVTVGSFTTTFIARFGNSGFAGQQLQKFFLVLMAFKLVQRTNSLNKLFKTAVASLPSILSLLLLWLILFIFFAILYVEVFGLTKWQSGESRDQNYSSIANALVMLAFMSTGEGWNQYMHDYALVYPQCTNSSISDQDSDCGSIGWAFTLFIAWNLLSMYIFVNLFTGVVVDSFSYVFQSSGGSKAITREQMRAFKKVWAEFANPKTGYLEKPQFVPFFGRLSGVFEVRIYPVHYSIPNILATSMQSAETWPSRVVEGIDLNKLNKVLDGIDYVSIRKRRAIYSRLYHEATITHQQGRGISFTDMLLLLAHHKLIVDHDALILRDLVVRTETNKLVTDLVNLDRVHSLLKTISHRRRFLAHLERKRAARYDLTQDMDIPAIIVDTMPETPPQSTRDISSAGYDSSPNSPTPDRRFHSPHVSFSFERGHGAGLQRSSRRTSELSMLSTDLGYRYPRDSMSEDDPQLVLSSMQNSIWGDLMSEAVEEEEKR